MKTMISILAIITLSVLAFYMLESSPYVLQNIVDVEKLENNKDFYEGKDITVPITPIIMDKGQFYVQNWNGKHSANVSTSNAKIDGTIGEKSIVTIKGKSFLLSKGYIEADSIHVHENYYLRMFLSPLAILILVWFLWKEKVLRWLHA